MSSPQLSVVILAWDQLELTRRCVESLRANTDVPYELIIVDNGSEPAAAWYYAAAADRSVRNETNLGFAQGMNRGLAAAEGSMIAFVNNDTAFPPGWASLLTATMDGRPQAGLVLPAVTAAGNPVSVRSKPGSDVIALIPFGELPSGVVYLLRTSVVRALGGWNEAYPVASAEDLDLCFTVWANDLEVVLDTRVLVEHVGQATVRPRLPERKELYRANLERFLDRWTSDDPAVPRLASCPEEVFIRNLGRARTAAVWIRRLIHERRAAADAPPPAPAPRRRRWRS